MSENTKHRLTRGAVLVQAVLCHVADSRSTVCPPSGAVKVGSSPTSALDMNPKPSEMKGYFS